MFTAYLHRTVLLAVCFYLHAPLLPAAIVTWTGGSMVNGDWNDAANWNPGVPANGDDLAFNASPRTATTVDIDRSISSLTFGVAAPSYTTTVDRDIELDFTGVGVVNNSGVTQTIVNLGATGAGLAILDVGQTRFYNSATADDLTIQNNGGVSSSARGGRTEFSDTSSAGTASITSQGGTAFARFGGVTEFFGSATAGTATLVSQGGAVLGAFGGTTSFFDTSTAGGATITAHPAVGGINNGSISFSDSAMAGTATITAFGDTTVPGGTISFSGSSSAESATITSQGGATSTVMATTNFSDTSTAGSAMVIASGGTVSGHFGGETTFQDMATADSSTLITHGGSVVGAMGGVTRFLGTSTGGTARAMTNAGGTFDISGLTSDGMDIGSIEGAGTYELSGDKILTVGGNNLSTMVSGVIQGNGELVKVGTGTLTLTGENTYSNGTTINNGTLLINNTTGSGTGLGSDVFVNSGGTFGGTGTTTESVIVDAGGTLAPGSSIGTLTVSETTLSTATSRLAVEIDPSLTPAADLLVVTGDLVLTGSQPQLQLSLLNAPLVLAVPLTFLVVQINSGGNMINGTFGSIVGLPSNYSASLSYNFSGSDVLGRMGSGNDLAVTLSTTAVPEPAWAAALGVLLAAAWGWWTSRPSGTPHHRAVRHSLIAALALYLSAWATPASSCSTCYYRFEEPMDSLEVINEAGGAHGIFTADPGMPGVYRSTDNPGPIFDPVTSLTMANKQSMDMAEAMASMNAMGNGEAFVFNEPTDERTLEFFIKMRSSDSHKAIIWTNGENANDDNRFHFYWNASFANPGDPAAFVDRLGADFRNSPPAGDGPFVAAGFPGFDVTINEWHHIAIVRRSVGANLYEFDNYFDYQLISTTGPWNPGGTHTRFPDPVSWYIAGRAGVPSQLNGLIDEFRMTDDAALRPDQFLRVVPEPGTGCAVLWAAFSLGLGHSRGRRSGK